MTLVNVTPLSVDKSLLDRYHRALDTANECPFHDGSWYGACQSAATEERAVFALLGFQPCDGELGFPVVDATGVSLDAGAQLTYASSRIWCHRLNVPRGYVRLGDWAWDEAIRTGWQMYQLETPSGSGVWKAMDTIAAPSYTTEELEDVLAQCMRTLMGEWNSNCAVCGGDTEYATKICGTTLELCDEHGRAFRLVERRASEMVRRNPALRRCADDESRRRHNAFWQGFFDQVKDIIEQAGLDPAGVQGWFERMVAARRYQEERYQRKHSQATA